MSAAAAAPKRILLSAVEPSADAIGAALMVALKEKTPGVRFVGCGGPLMAKEGLQSLFDIDTFAVIGPVGALKAWPAAMRGARALAQAALAETVDACVLIDSWSFSRIAAEKIRKTAPRAKLYKYVAPQVWASRPKRAETVARLFDGVVTLFDFENPHFENVGVPVEAVGSSLFAAAAESHGDGAKFRQREAIGDAPLLVVLPGSRPAEIKRLTPLFGETIGLLAKDMPLLRIVIVSAPGMKASLAEATAGWPIAPIFVDHGRRFDAFAAANAALAASGTVTTELAICGAPMVIGYRVDPLSALWIKSVLTIRYVAMVNIAADREVIPEFLQENCQPGLMAAALAPLFKDGPARQTQLSAFPDILRQLGVGGPPPAERAADAILRWHRAN